MSAVLTCAQLQPFDPAQADNSAELEPELEEPNWDDASAEPEIEPEEPAWEPGRVHVPPALIWAILLAFVLLVIVITIWGFTQGTWWY